MDIIRTGLTLLAISSVVKSFIIERQNYEFVWMIWKQFRLKIFFEALGVVFLTIIVVVMLVKIPGLKYGWLNLFWHNGGSIITRPIIDGSNSTNIIIRISVFIFFLALIFVIPFFTKYEEEYFRKGYNQWSDITKQSIKFGLMHLFMGVPIAVGIALIILGFFLGYKYKCAFDRNNDVIVFYYPEMERRAVLVSTTYHAMYNTIIFMIVLVVVASKI